VSPRPFDPGIVQVRLRHLRTLLDDLVGFGAITVDRLETERILRYAVERVLTQLVEVAAGINAHLGAALLGTGRMEYGDSFDLAVKAGALTEETARCVRPSAGTRNVLVHEYLDIDYEQVAEAARRAPEDYGRYVREVAAFLLRREEGEA
jgi:uncharacterized protein YutE (UPF0331/DUF86 family)